jgi:uncharacterized protein (TIGR02099 family)
MVQIPLPPLLKITLSLKSAKSGLLRVGRWLLWGAGVGIGVLHGIIVPRIDDFRPALEEQASRLLGVPVRIGRIEAHSQRLIPTLEFHHIALLDAQGLAALQLPWVQIVLWEPLVIKNPTVKIHRAKDGILWIAGFPIPSTPAAAENAYSHSYSLWDWLPELHIFHGTVTISDKQYSVPPWVLSGVNAVLRNRDGQHILHAETPHIGIKGNFNSRWEGFLFAHTEPILLTHLNPYIKQLEKSEQWGKSGKSGQLGEFTQGTVALNVVIATTVATAPSTPSTPTTPLRVEWTIRNGTVKLPQWFEHAALSVDDWTGSLEWKQHGIHPTVHPTLHSVFQFANADAAGKATLHWSEKNGFLLQGHLSRADATKVHRYLPLELPTAARHYVRDAVLGGTGTNVEFRIKGFFDDFRIAAHIESGTLAYTPEWPPLTEVSGDLVIQNDQLHLRARALVAGTQQPLRVTQAEAWITNLYGTPLLTVTGEAQGSLTEVLETVVKKSPLNAMLGGVLNQAQATGAADYRLHLAIPLDDIDQTTVRGSVRLNDNTFQIMPQIPPLTHAQGTVTFTESGFSIAEKLHARSLGGAVNLEGGLHFPRGYERLHIRGNATAEGLQEGLQLPLASLAWMQGSTDYHISLGLQENGLDGILDTTLQGMRIALPAPLNKATDAVLPLHFERTPDTLMPHQDRIEWTLGSSLHAVYERDVSEATARVLRGAVALGLNPDEHAPLPDEGVFANVQVDVLDVQEWMNALTIHTLSTTSTTSTASAITSGNPRYTDYLPRTVGFRGKEVTIAGHTLDDVVMGCTQQDGVWKTQFDSIQAKGIIELEGRERVYARFTDLVLEAASPTTSTISTTSTTATPLEIPPLELDVVIDHLTLYGKPLGRVEMTALNRFTLSTPEATLIAQRHKLPAQRTGMDFQLVIADSGKLLTRLGMPDVIRHGKGTLQGLVTWQGSPMIPNWASLNGKIRLDIGSGQFLKTEPGIAKLLGVVSLQALPRRLMLDFSDVFNEGFVFDSVRGDVEITQGIATTRNLEMKGVMANALLQGEADIVEETQNLRVVVVPDLNAGSASLLASTVNPVWGLGSFFAQLLFRQPFLDAITREFVINGTWLEPQFTEIPRP